MTSAEGLAIALMAAGRSKRFGEENKLNTPLGHRPLINWAAGTGRSITADHHFLVAPTDASFDAEALGYRLLANPHPEHGMASSLRLAAKAAREAEAHGLLILLADMPFMSTEHLRRLIKTFAADNLRPIFSAAPGKVAQPPALFPAAFLPKLETLEGDQGARVLARDSLLIECEADQLFDIDTLADLAQAQGRAHEHARHR